jgi:hypothetical protein
VRAEVLAQISQELSWPMQRIARAESIDFDTFEEPRIVVTVVVVRLNAWRFDLTLGGSIVVEAAGGSI